MSIQQLLLAEAAVTAITTAVNAGTYTLAGNNAALTYSGRKISASAGSYALNGVNTTLTHAGPTDPSFSNVVFLWEAEGTNHQTSGLVDDKNGRAITLSGTAELSTTHPRLGSTSLSIGTGGASTPNSSDYRLGNSSNSSKFVIEFSVYVDTRNTQEIMRFWSGSEHSWWVRLQTDGELRFLASSTGTTSFSMDVTTSGFGYSAAAQNDIAIAKDNTGKIRFFLGGVMKYSTTPADSVFFNSTNSTLSFEPQSGASYIDHIRLTASDDRGLGDAGYTFVEGPFPTS